MRCSKCGSDNPAGKRFCGDCGALLANHCPKCGAENPPGKRFCGECGTALGDAAPAAIAAGTAPVTASSGGERRHLTVMFCDLVGSTEIAAQLDPEEWREVVAGYHRAAAEAITRFGGHVAKYLGDGVMAYFGRPEAHDSLQFFDDPVFVGRDWGHARIQGFAHGAYCAFVAGRVNVARERITNAAAAINPTSPYPRASADMTAAVVHMMLRENEEAEILAARALELSEKHQIMQLAAISRCLLGHVRAQLGRAADGIQLIRRGISELPDIGMRQVLGSCTTWLAVAQQRAGALDDALETAERAIEMTPEVLLDRPETLRVRGELHLAKGHADLAEADFRDSIKLAKSMGAKAWELRTAISLARLLASQGRADEAHGILTEIYNWFTEGFDTPDLKEAKALLNELTP